MIKEDVLNVMLDMCCLEINIIECVAKQENISMELFVIPIQPLFKIVKYMTLMDAINVNLISTYKIISVVQMEVSPTMENVLPIF
jgi:hypothetical protein